MSTGLSFGFSKTVVVVGDRAERDRPIADGPAGGVFLKSDWFADQRLVDVDRIIPPADLAVMAYPPHLQPGVIFRLTQNAAQAARRWRVTVRWPSAAKRLMRAFCTLAPLQLAQTSHLLEQRAGPPRRRILQP